MARTTRDFVAGTNGEHRRITTPLWKAQSEAVLEALRTTPEQQPSPNSFTLYLRIFWGRRSDRRDR